MKKFVRVYGVRSLTNDNALVGLKTMQEAETIKHTWEEVHCEVCKLMFYKVPEEALSNLPTTFYNDVEVFLKLLRSANPAYYLPTV